MRKDTRTHTLKDKRSTRFILAVKHVVSSLVARHLDRAAVELWRHCSHLSSSIHYHFHQLNPVRNQLTRTNYSTRMYPIEGRYLNSDQFVRLFVPDQVDDVSNDREISWTSSVDFEPRESRRWENSPTNRSSELQPRSDPYLVLRANNHLKTFDHSTKTSLVWRIICLGQKQRWQGNHFFGYTMIFHINYRHDVTDKTAQFSYRLCSWRHANLIMSMNFLHFLILGSDSES